MIRVEKYGRRTFAVYEGEQLLAVVCYRKGAEALRTLIDGLRQRVAELEGRLHASAKATKPAAAKRTSKRSARNVPAPGEAPWNATA